MAEGVVKNEDTVDNDRQRYERELKSTKKQTVKRDDEQRATEEDKERKRPRSKTRGSRSNSNDSWKRRPCTQRRE